MTNTRSTAVAVGMLFGLLMNSHSETIDLSEASIITGEGMESQQAVQALNVLVEEVEKRTGILLPNYGPDGIVSVLQKKTPIIAIFLKNDGERHPEPLRKLAALSKGSGPEKPEGYEIFIDAGVRSAPSVVISAHDLRGILFGIGGLLRNLGMKKGSLTLPADFSLDARSRLSDPRTPTRIPGNREFVRWLEPGPIRSIYQRPRCIRLQQHRTHIRCNSR